MTETISDGRSCAAAVGGERFAWLADAALQSIALMLLLLGMAFANLVAVSLPAAGGAGDLAASAETHTPRAAPSKPPRHW
jgi:hypothetical protein